MEEVIKRKRGRPRKYPISTEPKVKRPRGRPRKEVDETELQKEKRPRGRPRKYDASELANKVKRPRGRPRKNQENELSNEQEALRPVTLEEPVDYQNATKSIDLSGAEELFEDEPVALDEGEYADKYDDYDPALIDNVDAIEPREKRSIKDTVEPKIALKSNEIIPAKHFKSEPMLTYEEKNREVLETFAPEEEKLNISTPHAPLEDVAEHKEKPIIKTKNTTGTKVVLITGATSGLGLAMAKNMAGLGQVVLAVGRRPSACRDAREEILAEYPDANIHFLVADLSLMGQVRILADEIKQKVYELGYDAIDVLIHNAGIQTNIHKVTYENHEIMWATNYLSAFLLTREVQPLLDASRNARVILTTNDAAKKTKLDWRNIRALTAKSDEEVYNQTKLADLMFALEYEHKYSNRDDLHAYCVNPGRVNTDLRSKNSRGWQKFLSKFGKKKAKSIQQGIETTMYLALAERLPKNTVLYENKKPSEPSRFALDPRNRSALWRYTELELNN